MGEAGPGCCGSFAKCILIIFNILFWIAGAIVLGVGIWMLADKNSLSILHVATQHMENADALMRVAAYVLIAVGSVAFITGFLGCCGALNNNSCMLCTYAVILAILIVLQLLAGIFIVAFKNQLQSGLDKSLNETIKLKYGTTNNEALTQGVDAMQKELKCCGSNGADDWNSSKWAQKNPGLSVPASCCVLDTHNDPLDKGKCEKKEPHFVHTKGCNKALPDWVKSHANVIMGVVFGLVAVQILGLILACCLRRSLRNQYQHV